MKLTVNVPDEMVEAVSAWEDGMDYTIRATQTGNGNFQLVTAEAVPVEDETVEETASPDSIEAAAAMFNEEE